ncbi:MAG: glycosyltransferase family 39 protein [Candidatus Omnitrophica bacterium]|nr:glycosyltransferase family 39 protein [Candidatus Omnitrophota bacterium]
MFNKIPNLIISKVSFILKKKVQILLLLIILLGVFLRIYALDRETFTGDEMLTASFSKSSICEICTNRLKAGHLPSYFIIIYYWMRLFGNDEFSLRFSSVIFGTASIYILFLVIKHLFDEKIALVGSFLFSVSSASIYYSQDARMYSLVVLFVLLSVLFLLKALNRNRNIYWLLYTIFTLFVLSLSASSIPVILFELLFVILTWRRYKDSVRKFIISLFLIAFFYLPLILVLIRSKGPDVLSWIPPPNLFSIVETFRLFGFKFIIPPLFRSKDPLNFLLGGFGLIFLGLLSIIGAFSVRKEKDRLILLLLWLAIPIFTLLVLSFLWTPVFGPVRYVLYSSCAYCILIAKGITSFKNKNIQIVLIALFSIATIAMLWGYYHSDVKQDWRAANDYIFSNLKEDEILIWQKQIGCKSSPWDKWSLGIDYYFLMSVIKGPFPKDLRRLSWNKVKLPSKIDTEGYKGVWLISSCPPYREIAFAENFRTSHFKGGEFKMVRWDRFQGLGAVFHYRRY